VKEDVVKHIKLPKKDSFIFLESLELPRRVLSQKRLV
jgi:hypothetical protein